ncbi:MAG: glutamine--fructose-6-phosphate transaminase (isomerizing), partial [Phycisphaerales bacterium]
MCGIVAYIGNKSAQQLLLEGLKRMEYRGYDSAGIAMIEHDSLRIIKAVGRVSKLEAKIQDEGNFTGSLGIAHTRWATHGKVTLANAHPHQDGQHGISLVHNGIIENYSAIRTLLEERGHQFHTETDTEVLGMLISHFYDPEQGMDLEKSVQASLREVRGAYAIAVICANEPDVMVCARKGSPLLVGIGSEEYIVASDPAAIVAHTSTAITLDDYSVVKITRDGFRTTTVDNEELTPKEMQLEMELDQIELGSYKHYMQKEIFEQPEALRTCMKGRLDKNEGRVVLGGLMGLSKELVKSKRIILTAQGTALHSAMIGEYLLEDLAKIPAECQYASEFRYRNPLIEDGSVVVAVSQSGETADTLAALHEAKDRGALSLGVINVVGSTLARDTDAGVYLRVGPEIGVASTKAFIGQVAVMTMISLFMARRRMMSPE